VEVIKGLASLHVRRREYLLGADISKSVTLNGFDELGRIVSVGMIF
jgi:hypothetical protein